MLSFKNIGVVSFITLCFSQAAFALPTISSPNDIAVGRGNTIFYTNTTNNSITQCQAIMEPSNAAILESCRTFQIAGMVNPFKMAIVSAGESRLRFYVTKKDSNIIYSFRSNASGNLDDSVRLENFQNPTTQARPFDFDVNPQDSENANILEFKNVGLGSRIYVSTARAGRYGFFGSCEFGDTSPGYTHCVKPENINVPTFYVSHDGSDNILYGLGRLSSSYTNNELRYPLRTTISDDGRINSNNIMGGTAESTAVDVPNTAYSMASRGNNFWVSHNEDTLFTLLHGFLPSGTGSRYSSHSLSEANVTLKTLVHTRLEEPIRTDVPIILHTNLFALHPERNQVSRCTTPGAFLCKDATRYLIVTNGSGDRVSAVNINADSNGVLYFENANFSPLTASDLSSVLAIPDSFRAAFIAPREGEPASCLDKLDDNGDISSGFTNRDTTNGKCTLRYDFRNILPPTSVNTFFDLGFIVNSGYSLSRDVRARIRVNVNITPVSDLQFRSTETGNNVGSVLPFLHLQAGDSGSFYIYNRAHQEQSATPQLEFVVNNPSRTADTTFESYFTQNCESSPLNGMQTCLVSYRLGTQPQDGRYLIRVKGGSDTSFTDLPITISSTARIVARIGAAEPDPLTIHPGIEFGEIRLTNVGASEARELVADIEGLPTRLSDSFSGGCLQVSMQPIHGRTSTSDGGYCSIRYTLPRTFNINGEYNIRVRGSNFDQVDIPLVIAPVEITGGIGVHESNTNRNIELGQSVDIFRYTRGTITITNNTGAMIPDFALTLSNPELLIDGNEHRGSTISGSCFSTDGSEAISLNTAESCDINYINDDDTESRPLLFTITYANTNHQTSFTARFLDSPVGQLMTASGAQISQLEYSFDVSNPNLVITVTNIAPWDLDDISLRVDGFADNMVSTTCTEGIVSMDSCIITLSISDSNPMIGQYPMELRSSRGIVSRTSINVQRVPLDRVKVENRGGYVMDVDFTGEHENADGNDHSCDGPGLCYGDRRSGRYPNPQNRVIEDVPGRMIYFKIIAGKTRRLPSCNGGKIKCTRATLNPNCYYFSDGTRADNAQNTCASEN